MLRIISLYLLILLSGTSLHSQEARQYTFRHLSTAHGLASNLVNGMVQDADGYIWIATLNGLQRYDGFNFLLFTHQPENITSLPANNVSGLYKDRQNRIWVFTSNNDVGIFDTHRFRFRRVVVQGLPPQAYYSPKYIFEGGDGTVYLHDIERQLFRYDTLRNRFVPVQQLLPIPQGWRLRRIAWDSVHHSYWAASDSGLLQYNTATRDLKIHGYNGNGYAKNLMPSMSGPFLGLHVADNGMISFFTWPPNSGMPILHQYNPDNNHLHTFSLGPVMNGHYHEVSQFFVQRNGRQWIAGNPLLVEIADSGRLLPVTSEGRSEQSIRFDRANAMLEDREGNLWVGTDNGIFYFNPATHLFESYSLLRPGGIPRDGPVQTVLETNDRVFVGSWGLGLFIYDKNWNPKPTPPALKSIADGSMIWDMQAHSRTGKIWIGMQNGQLEIFDPKTGSRRTVLAPEFNGRTIRQIAEDKWGNLWFGTQGGRLVKWTFSEGAREDTGFKLVMQTGLVHKLTAHQNDIWVGTLGHGLLQVDARSAVLLRTFGEQGRSNKRLSSASPSDMITYNDSTLVVLAGAINIINTNNYTVQRLGAEEGVLPSNSAVSCQRDGQGALWVGMANGLCRVNLQQRTYTFYDRRDGIIYDNFPVASAFQLKDGRMVFTTDHNFMVFRPNNAVEASVPLKPQLTSLKVGTQSLLLDSLYREGRLVLPHDKNSLAFDFSTLNFGPASKLQYYHRLEGIDKDWVATTGKPQAIYSYLPPGTYTLWLRTENGDGQASEDFRLFPIVIRPPFWQSWWFYCVLALIVAGAIIWFDRERMRRLREVQQTRLQIAGNLHDELDTNLHHINILSEMARMKSGQSSELSQSYLEQISERSNNMIILMDDMIWSIDPNKDTLKDTLVRLQEFVAGLQSRHEARIHLAVGKKVPFLKLGMKNRHEFFVVLKEILRMAVEQAGAKDVLVNINLVKGKLTVKLMDETVTELSAATLLKKETELRKRIAAVQGELDMQLRGVVLSMILVLPVK